MPHQLSCAVIDTAPTTTPNPTCCSLLVFSVNADVFLHSIACSLFVYPDSQTSLITLQTTCLR